MSVRVCRLIDTPAGLYRMVGAVLEDPGEADARAAEWWALPETLGVVTHLLPASKEDARYERPGLDWARVPAQWPRRPVPQTFGEGEAQKMRARAEAQQVAVTPEPAGPTLFEEPAAESIPATAPAPGVEGPRRCPCCWGVVPLEGFGEGTKPATQTPSGRLADKRCMHCGRPQPGATSRTLQAQYAAFQQVLGKLHALRPKPRRGGFG